MGGEGSARMEEKEERVAKKYTEEIYKLERSKKSEKLEENTSYTESREEEERMYHQMRRVSSPSP